MRKTKRFLAVPLVLLFVSVFGGCASYFDDARNTRVRDEHNLTELQRDVAVLKERISGLEIANERIASDVTEMKSVLERSNTAISERLDRTDRAQKALHSEIEAGKKETVQVLSVKMAEIMKAQAAHSRQYSGGNEHIVAAGENLSKIAQTYGVTVDAIVKANNLQDANLVRSGMKLVIPR